MTMAHGITALREEISTAFGGRPYPGDEAIVDRQPGCRGLEADEAWQLFQGKSWREIAEGSDPVQLRDHMGFLSFEGFVYYLPAFLHLAFDVDNPHGIDDAFVFKLWSFPEEVSSRLEPAEKRVTVRVLERLAAEYHKRRFVPNDAQRALDDHWAYFTDEELGLSG